MKSFAVGCLSAALGVLLGLAFAFVASPFFQTNKLTLTPTQVPAPSDITLTASAKFINVQLEQAIRQSGFGTQASVTLASPNLVQIAAAVDASAFGLPITINVTVSMRVLVQRGRILLAVDKVDAGGLPVVQSIAESNVEKLRASAEDQINRSVQRALQGTGLRVSNVRVTPAEMSIDFVSE